VPDDPLLAHFGHPILPAGYNSAPNDGDEVDGPGYNEPIWPYLFNAFIPLEVLIITLEMLEVFDGCADYTVLSVPDQIDIEGRPETYVLAPAPSVYVPAAGDVTYVAAAANNLTVFPAEQRTLVITEERKVA
jgi:hypothetical protein